MFLYPVAYNKTILTIQPESNLKRKVKFSPPYRLIKKRGIRTFFSASLRASLTVEAALVLPLFLFAMIAALQYGNVTGTAVQFGTAMSETGEMMAAAAYVKRFGGDLDKAPELAVSALSAAYAQHRIMSLTDSEDSVKNANMILSSIMQGDDMIDLVLTYQIRSPVSIIRLPGSFFLQRARVRAWTGRSTGGEGNGDGEGADGTYVYVTETGSVYHEDPECTHLKLSIREVEKSQLARLRNSNGEKYHDCERCGGKAVDGMVYITKEGNRCHSSLSCSGLKRTVRQVSREELGNMRACSKCGKHED